MELLKKIKDNIEKIEKESFFDILDDTLEKISQEKGIYIFKNKKTGKIDYIGSATGKKGLFQRISKQHLWNNYKKSVFRIKIAKYNKLNEGETVDFIADNFILKTIVIESDIRFILLLEHVLIYKYNTKFNSENNK